MKHSVILLLVLVLCVSMLPSGASMASAGNPALKGGIHLVELMADGLVLGLDTPSYQIEKKLADGVEYQQFLLSGAQYTQTAGSPALPYFSVMVGLPPTGRVSVEVIADQAVDIPGSLNFLPAVQPRQGAQVTDAYFAETEPKQTLSEPVYRPEALVYAANKLIPAQLAELRDEAWVRQQRIARLVINPLQYNPVTGRAVLHQNLSIRLKFDEVPLINQASAATTPFEAALSSTIINYQQVRQWQPSLNVPATWNPGDTNGCPQSMCYKIIVDHDGIYKVSYESLAGLGLVGASTNPTNLQLTSQGQPVAYQFVGDADNQFEVGEYVLFFGQKLQGDRLAALYAAEDDNWITLFNGWSPQFNHKMVEKYTDDNVYWLSVGTAPGLRINPQNGTPASATSALYYRQSVRYDLMTWLWVNNYTSEDIWFSDLINTTAIKNYPLSVSNLASGTHQAKVSGELQAYTHNISQNPDHHTLVTLNTATVIDDALWDDLIRRHFEGLTDQINLTDGLNYVNLSQLLDLYPSQQVGTYYLDWLELEYSRQFVALFDALDFRTVEAGTWKYAVNGLASPAVLVWNVANPLTPLQVTGTTYAAGVVTFEAYAPAGERFYVVGSNTLQTPKALTAYAPPDITTTANGADYLIITHSAFAADVQRLANYRAAQGLRVKVIDIQDIYNQFNFGITHPIATRNFLAWVYSHWMAPAPTYVVLVGDGNWRIKKADAPAQYILPNRQWVDPYTGEVDSSNALASVVGTDIMPDYLISRIPVNSSAELNNVIDKIIAHESLLTIQPWQRHVLFASDNVPDDAGDFVAMANLVISQEIVAPFTADTVFENDFGCTTAGSPECALARAALSNGLNNTGASMLVYNGHGAQASWTAEGLMKAADVTALTNGSKLPVVVSMTCLDGFWDYVASSPTGIQESLAEVWMRSPNQGAVAVFASTGFGLSSGHDVMQAIFLNQVISQKNYRLGSVAYATRLAVYNTGTDWDLVDSYTVFGDPAMNILQEPGFFMYLPITLRQP